MRALLSLVLCVAPVEAPELEATLAAAYLPREHARFVAPTGAERVAFRHAFADLVRAAGAAGTRAPAALRARFASLGFRLGEVRAGAGVAWTLVEEHARGGGAYALRVGEDAGAWAPERPGAPRGVTRCVVMAPHPVSDRETGAIGRALFAASRARAFLQATVHRTLADPAHRDDTFFQAAVEALDEAAGRQLFLQLHGFEATRHEGLADGVGAILSDGRRAGAGPEAVQVAARVRARHPGGFLAVYGAEARKLGGTTNTQARHLNRTGRSLFVHLEMGADVRAQLARDAAARPMPERSFARTLAELLGL